MSGSSILVIVSVDIGPACMNGEGMLKGIEDNEEDDQEECEEFEGVKGIMDRVVQNLENIEELKKFAPLNLVEIDGIFFYQ